MMSIPPVIDSRLPFLCDEIPGYAIHLAVAYQRIVGAAERPTLRELIFSWRTASANAPVEFPASQYHHYLHKTFTTPDNEDWQTVREYWAADYSLLQLASTRQHRFVAVHDQIPSNLATWFELTPRPPMPRDGRKISRHPSDAFVDVWMPFAVR